MMKKKNEQPQLIYTDKSLVKSAEHDNARTVTLVNKAVHTWERVTGYKIESVDELEAITQNPTDYYIKKIEAEQADVRLI